MSSTRRVESGERRRQNGWASAPEFDFLRGLNGTAVAFKAALQDDPEKRELLYFLQALSLRDGGLKRIARELVEMFPERLGSPTMIEAGCRPGKRLSQELRDSIDEELHGGNTIWDLLHSEEDPEREHCQSTADEFLDECRERAERLDEFLEELCCNPKMEIAATEWKDSYRRRVSTSLGDDVRSWEFKIAEVPYFRDVLGALFEYQRRHIERARADFVETSIGKIVCEAMDYVLDTGRSALIEGNSGFGKTTALKAWCEMHPGRARYVQLTGITPRTAFFRRLAKTLGVASGGGMSSGKIQARVEDFLQRTRLILVVDEGQYLWPQGKRIESHPELINWLNTACYNEGVPFVISATKQFTLRRQAVEKSTDWSSEQSRRRTRKVFQLPDMPSPDEATKPWHAPALARMKKDLLIVAAAKLGVIGLGGENVGYVAGYALVSRGYFQAITDAIEDAQLIARRAGRDRVTARDLKTAVNEWRAPSDAALIRVYDSKPEGRRRYPRAEAPAASEFAPVESPENEPLNAHSRGANDSFSALEIARRSTRPEAEPALTG